LIKFYSTPLITLVLTITEYKKVIFPLPRYISSKAGYCTRLHIEKSGIEQGLGTLSRYIKWVAANLMLEGELQWTSMPSRGREERVEILLVPSCYGKQRYMKVLD